MKERRLSARHQILERMSAQEGVVWTPGDFVDLAPRAAVDKALQRLAQNAEILRIVRGLYFRPRNNRTTKKANKPESKAIIDAVSRRHRTRTIVDVPAAASDLDRIAAVPGPVTVLTGVRLRPIVVDSHHIQFKTVAPSRLYWAGRPGMRVVQALYRLRGRAPSNPAMLRRVLAIVRNPTRGEEIRCDLREGIHTLPIWMQQIVRPLLDERQTRRPRRARSRSART